jgi:hypothetical protein
MALILSASIIQGFLRFCTLKGTLKGYPLAYFYGKSRRQEKEGYTLIYASPSREKKRYGPPLSGLKGAKYAIIT